MKLPASITRVAHKVAYKTKKYSPELLSVAGIAMIVGGVVVACRETTYAADILDEHYAGLDEIEQAKIVVNGEPEDTKHNYSDKQIALDTFKVNATTAWEFTKLYAPSAMLIVGGIGCMLAAQGILKKRNAALTAAYNALQAGFEKYRQRVKKELGEDVDRHFLAGTPADIKDPKTGKTIMQLDANDQGIPEYSQYARVFDASSPRWVNDAEYNLTFLNQQQRFANQKLIADGFLFLNDVYDALGIPRTQQGQIVGWLYNGGGDDYIDFGIYKLADQKARDFVNGYERNIILDFNVDGVIVDQI